MTEIYRPHRCELDGLGLPDRAGIISQCRCGKLWRSVYRDWPPAAAALIELPPDSAFNSGSPVTVTCRPGEGWKISVAPETAKQP